ncbi:MAG TPA: hypothetical protein VGN01_01855 [Acidobacteriaceae bacterium]|jgi:hypothetical protein
MGRKKGTDTRVRNILGNYFWWTYERGSIHYDIMVTLILAFMFISPHFIDFGDRPVEPFAFHGSEVLVKEAGTVDGSSRFMFEIRTGEPGGPQAGQTDDERRAAILRAVEPISGAVTLERYEPIIDPATRKVVAYNAWVIR